MMLVISEQSPARIGYLKLLQSSHSPPPPQQGTAFLDQTFKICALQSWEDFRPICEEKGCCWHNVWPLCVQFLLLSWWTTVQSQIHLNQQEQPAPASPDGLLSEPQRRWVKTANNKHHCHLSLKIRVQNYHSLPVQEFKGLQRDQRKGTLQDCSCGRSLVLMWKETC